MLSCCLVVFCSIVCVWVIRNSGTGEDQVVFTTLRPFGVDSIQIMLHPAVQVFDAIKELLVMDMQRFSCDVLFSSDFSVQMISVSRFQLMLVCFLGKIYI